MLVLIQEVLTVETSASRDDIPPRRSDARADLHSIGSSYIHRRENHGGQHIAAFSGGKTRWPDAAPRGTRVSAGPLPLGWNMPRAHSNRSADRNVFTLLLSPCRRHMARVSTGPAASGDGDRPVGCLIVQRAKGNAGARRCFECTAAGCDRTARVAQRPVRPCIRCGLHPSDRFGHS